MIRRSLRVRSTSLNHFADFLYRLVLLGSLKSTWTIPNRSLWKKNENFFSIFLILLEFTNIWIWIMTTFPQYFNSTGILQKSWKYLGNVGNIFAILNAVKIYKKKLLSKIFPFLLKKILTCNLPPIQNYLKYSKLYNL